MRLGHSGARARARRPARSPAPPPRRPAAGRAPAPRRAARGRGSARRCRGRSRAWRAAVAPIETWSSWFAEVGIESTDAGWASTLFSDARAAAVYWSSIIPELRPAAGARNGGRPPLRRASRSSAIRRSLIAPSSARASFAKSSARAIGSPWKLPPEMTSPPPVAAVVGVGDAALREDERVVGRRVHLDVEDAPQVVERVADGAVDLGHAAQRVRVLDLVRRGVVVGHEPGVAQQVAQLAGDRDLARVRAGQLVGGGVGHVRPEQRLDRLRRGDRRRAGQPVRVGEQERPDRAHQLGPVEEREALLRLEDERLQALLPEGQERRHDVAAELHLAAPDQRQREVGQRRQVARGARRSPGPARRGGCRAPGSASRRSTSSRAAARVAEGQGVRPQEEHRPDDVARERRPDADRVAREQVLLEAAGVGRRDEGRGEVAEAGRDPVDDLAGRDEALDDGAGLCHPLAGVDVEDGPGAAAGDRLDVGDGQVGAGEDDLAGPRAGRRTARLEVGAAGVVDGARGGIAHAASIAPADSARPDERPITARDVRSAALSAGLAYPPGECLPSSTRSSSPSSRPCTAPSATSA